MTVTAFQVIELTIAGVGVAVAAGGLAFAGFQLRHQANASHLQAWLEISDTANRRWLHLIQAEKEDEIKFAKGEIFNFIEGLARDINEKRLPKGIRSSATPLVLHTLELIASSPVYRNDFRSMLTREKTFLELRRFVEARKTMVGDYANVMQLFSRESN